MVKLSYYFPVSSDSISIKKQLLESGVLDITNERMYRMAPEAVDPSILSRGSLSYRRYTRSALLMLRDDRLSKKTPNCLKDSRLLKFPIWKTFNIAEESITTETTSKHEPLKEENPFNTKYRYTNNNISNNYNNNHNNAGYPFVRTHATKHYSNKFNSSTGNNGIDRIQLKYDSREGRFIEKYDATKWGNGNFMQRYGNYQPRNFDRKNLQSSYMMPNFVKNKYEKMDNNKHESEGSLFCNENGNHNRNLSEESKIHDVNTNVNGTSTKTNGTEYKVNDDAEIQRYGSGRISIQNKNWNYMGKNSDINSSYGFSNTSRKYSDNNNNKSWPNHHAHNYYNNHTNYHNHDRYRQDSGSSSVHSYNSEEPEWLSCGPTSQNDVIELHGFDDDPASDKETEKDDITTNKNLIDQHDLDKVNNKDNISENEKKINVSIVDEYVPTRRNELQTHVDTMPITSKTLATSATNDEIQSVCTSTVPSPPPARSTPTKLLNFNLCSNNQKLNIQNNPSSNNNFSTNDNNKKNYYSLQFSFDNFLDYDTLNNMVGTNSKSKSTHWFKNQHTGTLHNNDIRNRQHLTMLEKKNHKSYERFPKNAINVKDLEDQMRNIGFNKHFPHQNCDNNNGNQYQHSQNAHNANRYNQQQQLHHNQQQSTIKASVNAFTQCAYKQMLAQANSIVKHAQDPEVFRHFLDQINSMNQLAALSQLSKPLLMPQPLLTNNVLGVTQKRIPSTRELEFHTRNIVQNALFRKRLQEQQRLRLQELITLQSNINPNAPEFTPTSVLRKMSAEKENFTASSTVGNNFAGMHNEEKFFNKSIPNNFHHHQQHFQQYQMSQHQHQHQQPLKQQTYNQKFSSILNNFSNISNKSSDFAAKTGEKHIKWDNEHLNYIPNRQPTGRPILKGSNTNSTSNISSFHHTSILKQQQSAYCNQNEGNRHGFDYFLKTKYNSINSNSPKATETSISSSSRTEQNWCQHSKHSQKQQSFHDLETGKTATNTNPFADHFQSESINLNGNNEVNHVTKNITENKNDNTKTIENEDNKEDISIKSAVNNNEDKSNESLANIPNEQ